MSESTEAQSIFVRRSHPKDPPELVIVLGGEAEHSVYILRPSQVKSLALDLVRYAIVDGSEWAQMWAKKFDHPERV
jgi:hypothetical protein